MITNGTATLTNRTGGAYVLGVWTPGTGSTSTCEASCQPDKGAQFVAMRDTGNRRATYVKMFLPTTATVRPESQVGLQEATTFTHPVFPDITFRVTGAEWRQADAPPHILVRAVSIDESGDRA